MGKQMIIAPATQVKNAIVAHLRGAVASYTLPIPETQIRGILDVTGTPKDVYGITVNVEDEGDWAGNTNRILVRIHPTITVFSHIDEDPDGSLCDSLTSDTLQIMQDIQYGLDGWIVSWNGAWAVTDTVMDSSFRQNVLSAILPINKI